jgi:hypothetical protein
MTAEKIEYRAVLRTHRKLERPVQSISFSLSTIENWISATLIKYPDGEIILYQSEEREAGRFVGPERIKMMNNNICTQCQHSSNLHLLTCKTGDRSYGACSHINCYCNKYSCEISK